MDVTPPPAAGKTAHRPAPLSAPAQPTGAALVLRRLGAAVAGLAVAALAGTACVLSFDPLRLLAGAGGARADLAYLYPAGFDALLAIALISVLLLRPARLLVRLQAVFVLALLVVGAAAANVVVATDIAVDARQAAVVVAVVPWAMLVIGLWLLVLPGRRPQTNPAPDGGAARAGHDIVPFGGEERDPELAPPLETAAAHVHTAERDPRTAADELEFDVTPVVPPTPAPETPPVDELPPLPDDRSPLPDRGTPAPDEGPQRPDERTPSSPAPQKAVRSGEQGRATGQPRELAEPEVHDVPAPADGPSVEHAVATPSADHDVPAPTAVAPSEEHAVPAAADHDIPAPSEEHAVPGASGRHAVPEPEPDQRLVPQPRGGATPGTRPERVPDRPLRWGDLVRPAPSDVLVHPLPQPAPEQQLGDTQPYPQFTDKAAPTTGDSTSADTRPYPRLREEATPVDAAGETDEVPDPAHDADVAEETEAPPARRQPYIAETTAPPSGRMRSTPLPPEDGAAAPTAEG